MANADPTSPKRISRDWLVCRGMALGALLVLLVGYVAVGVCDAFCGSYALSAEDLFGCARRQFVITALSIIPGGVVGFIIAYWTGRRRYAPDS
jgi:ABC-type xylose transport system permease subunit